MLTGELGPATGSQRAIKAAAETLIAMEDKLTQWDVAVGDGDCGITTTRGAKGMLDDAAAKYPLDDPSATALQVWKKRLVGPSIR